MSAAGRVWAGSPANAVLFVVLCVMRFGPELVTNVVMSLRDMGHGQLVK